MENVIFKKVNIPHGNWNLHLINSTYVESDLGNVATFGNTLLYYCQMDKCYVDYSDFCNIALIMVGCRMEQLHLLEKRHFTAILISSHVDGTIHIRNSQPIEF